MEDLISRALVIYLIGGPTPWPRPDPAALAEALGRSQAADLRPTLDAIAAELFTIPVDWENHTLQSGTAHVTAEMHLRHPEFTDEALRALGNLYSYLIK